MYIIAVWYKSRVYACTSLHSNILLLKLIATYCTVFKFIITRSYLEWALVWVGLDINKHCENHGNTITA